MTVKIDGGLPNRISMSVTTGRQSQGSTFGEKVSTGLHAAGSVISNGASLLGGVMPGAGLVSAAVSSVTGLTNMQGSTASAVGYSPTGVVALGGGSTSGGTPVATGSPTMPNLTGGSTTTSQVGMMNNELASMTAENAKLLQVQIAMQRENEIFTSVSNALKTKHDTVKNTIGNVR